MALTKEDLTVLAKPLPVAAHEYLNGNVYITEEDINDRLDAVDPAWEFIIMSIVARGDAITVQGRLIVKGSARDGVGMATVVKTKDGSKEANEAEKSAATDALKRAARMFGIGRYILGMGKTVTDEKSLKLWLAKNYPATKPSTPGTPPPAAKPDKFDPAAHGLGWSKEDMTAFWNSWHKENEIAQDVIFRALGVNKLSEWKQSLGDADKRMTEYLK
jgi:hypothetical protein